jgi:hypothetical protein
MLDNCSAVLQYIDMTRTWTVTTRTGEHTWSVIEVPAEDHLTAITEAVRLTGGAFVSVV